MARARAWNMDVEENFRLQTVGWRDLVEYQGEYGDPVRWDNGLPRCLRVKKNGFYTYWTRERECEDKYLNRVKLYFYADGSEARAPSRKK